MIPGPAPKGRGRNKPRSTGRVLFIEVHQNDYLVFDKNIATRSGFKARRVPSVPDGVFQIKGFTAGSAAVPPSGRATIKQVADLLTKDPTASVILRVSSVKDPAKTTVRWQSKVQEAIRDLITDPIIASDSRFEWNDPQTGSDNTVEIVVSHPKL